MPSSVRVTYAHRKRRARPREGFSSDMDDITCRKRSRRVALAEQSEVELIRDHLAKRIKHNQERPLDSAPQDGITFQTPFSSSPAVLVSKPLVPEQLSPVPAAKRVMSRTRSKNLKENIQTLASPFSSRPGSAASSPKHNGRGRSSRRVLRTSLHAKSRTLSGVFKQNAQWISRKNSTVSLKDASKEPRARNIKHHRYPSSPTASYMRPQFAQEDWMVPPKVLSRTFDDYNAIASPGGSIHSDASFYAGQPQSCSTPAISQLRKAPDLCERDSFFASFSLRKDHTKTGGLDIDMRDDTEPLRRQTIHMSGNSIFSSSDEFTIGSPAANKDVMTVGGNGVTREEGALARVSHQNRTLAGSFVAEYDVPLSDVAHSPASTAATKMLGAEGVRKESLREELFCLPGTSPPRCGILIIRRCKKPGTPSPPESPHNTTAPRPPSSPASDLAQELGSMDIRGDGDTRPDRETQHRSSAPTPLLTRSHSLQDALFLAESSTRKSVKRIPARNRADTIRASDFSKHGPGGGSLTASSQCNVRRTRSGTVVGPDSTLAIKGAPATGLAAVQSGSESESDDELLLKDPWVEDLVYLGLVKPLGEDAESDDLDLFQSGFRRPRSRRG